jgi:hypothetical protein
MRHSWLALATLVLFAGEASAAMPHTCACPERITLPQQGASGLPLNTKILVIDKDSTFLARIEPSLTPDVLYLDDSLNLSFTPSAARDDAAPEPPANVHVSIASSLDRDTQEISAWGRYAPDTAVVRIAIEQGDHTRMLYTTPHRLYFCTRGIDLFPGTAKLRIASIDQAGNESAELTTTIEIAPLVPSEEDRVCPSLGGHHHYRHGHGFEILFLLLLYPMGLIAWLVIVLVRRASVKREPAEPLSLLAAEEVVRRLIRWQVIWSAMLIAGAIGITVGIDKDYGIFVAPWLFSSFGQLFLQRSALQLLDRPETDAARRGRWLVVTTLKSSVTVRASDIDFVVGNRRGIPTSVVQ